MPKKKTQKKPISLQEGDMVVIKKNPYPTTKENYLFPCEGKIVGVKDNLVTILTAKGPIIEVPVSSCQKAKKPPKNLSATKAFLFWTATPMGKSILEATPDIIEQNKIKKAFEAGFALGHGK